MQSNNYTHAHGRRKEAAARARLFKGSGEMTVNGKPFNEYFQGEIASARLQGFLNTVKSAGIFYATVRVAGSGKSSQLDAVIHSLARSFVAKDETLKPTLRRAGYITRDPRVKERRKYGMAQKARKGKQSPKR